MLLGSYKVVVHRTALCLRSVYIFPGDEQEDNAGIDFKASENKLLA